MTRHGFGDTRRLVLDEPKLDRAVSVALVRLLLHNDTRTGLQDRRWQGRAILSEDLGHPDFLSDDSCYHGLSQRLERAAQSLIVFLTERLDLDVDTGRKIEFHECVDGLGCRLEDIDQPLVRPNLKLLP